MLKLLIFVEMIKNLFVLCFLYLFDKNFKLRYFYNLY